MAGVVKADKFIVTADRLAVDEDLWDRFAAAGHFDKFVTYRIVIRHVDFFEFHIFGLEEFFGGGTVGAITRGINNNFFRHGF